MKTLGPIPNDNVELHPEDRRRRTTRRGCEPTEARRVATLALRVVGFRPMREMMMMATNQRPGERERTFAFFRRLFGASTSWKSILHRESRRYAASIS